MKTVEAETEGKKAETEGKKADALKAQVELKILENKQCAKDSFKAVINYDALGLKTTLAKKMKEFNLAGTITRLLRPGGSFEYDTELIFEGSTRNVGMMKNFLNGEEFESTIVKGGLGNFDSIRISQTTSDFHRSGSSGTKEALFEIDPGEDSLKKSGSSRTSRNSSVQQNFTSALLLRDFSGEKEMSTCLICAKRKPVQGAHIYPVSGSRSNTLYEVSRLNNVNDVRNGILLCESCHKHFDDGLCGFDQDWCVIIEEALMQVPEYNSLVGRQAEIGDGPESPLKCLMKVQEEFCKLVRDKRHSKVDTFKFSCSQCNGFWKKEAGMTNHSCKPILKTLLFTPPEKRRPEGTGVLGEEPKSCEVEEVKLDDSVD